MMKIDVPLNLRYGGIVFLVFGPVLILLAGMMMLGAKAAKNWPTVEARVSRSEIEVSKKRVGLRRPVYVDYFTARVEYEYVVDGVQYTGDRIHMSLIACGFDRGSVEQWTRKYPPGAEISIHYSPRKASRAVIDPTPDIVGLSYLLGGGFLLIPIGFVMLRIAGQMQPATTKRVARDVGQTRRKKAFTAPKTRQAHWLVRTVAVIIGLAFFFVGALALPRCVELCVQAENAPGSGNRGTAVHLTAVAILGVVAIFGAFLICLGTRRVRAR